MGTYLHIAWHTKEGPACGMQEEKALEQLHALAELDEYCMVIVAIPYILQA